jgi:hypothetical protein
MESPPIAPPTKTAELNKPWGKNQPSRRSVLCSLLTGFANAGDAEQDGEGSGSEIERREGRTTTL